VILPPSSCELCADAAVTARVVAVDGSNAIVEADGCRQHVGVELVEPLEPGDLLLCHAGIALQRVDEA